MSFDPASVVEPVVVELELDDFEDIATEEPSFSRLELDFFAEGDELEAETD